MHTPTLLAAIATTAMASLSAQTGSFTVPAGFLTTENSASAGVTPHARAFGRFKVGRHQIITGELTGKGTKVLSRLSFRRDGEQTLPGSGQARRWQQVDVKLGDASYAGVQNNMDRNLSGTSVVFRSALSLATAMALPTARPMRWGGSGLTFPFSAPYTYSGTRDLGVELRFIGGSISNWRPKNRWSDYTVEGFSPAPTSHHSAHTTHGFAHCKDSSAPTYGLALYRLTTSAKPGVNGVIARYADKMTGKAVILGSAPDTWHTFFYGTGNQRGFYIGQGCNPIHMTRVLGVFRAKTVSAGHYARASQSFPYNAAWVGTEIWSQATYTDTKLRTTKFTHATRSIIPSQPVAGTVKLVQLFRWDLVSSISGIYRSDIPIMKFN